MYGLLYIFGILSQLFMIIHSSIVQVSQSCPFLSVRIVSLNTRRAVVGWLSGLGWLGGQCNVVKAAAASSLSLSWPNYSILRADSLLSSGLVTVQGQHDQNITFIWAKLSVTLGLATAT